MAHEDMDNTPVVNEEPCTTRHDIDLLQAFRHIFRLPISPAWNEANGFVHTYISLPTYLHAVYVYPITS